MFVKQASRNVLSLFTRGLRAHCDADEFVSEGSNSLIEEADAQLSSQNRIKTPMSYETMKASVLGSAAVSAFDGFRIMVVKQVNCNAASQHTFMLGSSQTQNQPYYNYTLILPLDDRQEKNVRIRADLDFNIDAEASFPLQENVPMKAALSLNDQGNALVMDVGFSNSHSTSQMECSIGPQTALAFNFMQAITPGLSLGGASAFSLKDYSMKSTLAALYDHDGHVCAAHYELDSKNAQLVYKREVNPHRVTLLTDVQYDGNSGNSKMNLSAQYALKQSKLSMGVDSDLTLRSVIESNIAQGVQLHLSAEIPQLKQDACKFGYALMMG